MKQWSRFWQLWRIAVSRDVIWCKNFNLLLNDLTRTLHGDIRFNYLLNFLLVAFCNAKILLLILRNNEFTWAKSTNLISCCNEEWLELNSFFKTLTSDFLWRISSCNKFNWHCLYVEEALTDRLLTWKFKILGATLLSLHHNKISKSSSALHRR